MFKKNSKETKATHTAHIARTEKKSAEELDYTALDNVSGGCPPKLSKDGRSLVLSSCTKPHDGGKS
jgi:hypothetical protein